MSAIFSPCGQYRYQLSGGGEQQAAWCMLNPSKANGEDVTDPTAQKIARFSRDWGYNGQLIVNAYGLVTTDPAGLWRHPDPVGRDNDAHLAMIATMPLIVVAWGTHAQRPRVRRVVDILTQYGAELWCLGVNLDGSPKHPLYLPYTAKLQRWFIDGPVNP